MRQARAARARDPDAAGQTFAILVSVAGMDLEQIAVGHSDAFWQTIRECRGQKTMSRAELEKRLAEP